MITDIHTGTNVIALPVHSRRVMRTVEELWHAERTVESERD